LQLLDALSCRIRCIPTEFFFNPARLPVSCWTVVLGVEHVWGEAIWNANCNGGGILYGGGVRRERRERENRRSLVLRQTHPIMQSRSTSTIRMCVCGYRLSLPPPDSLEEPILWIKERKLFSPFFFFLFFFISLLDTHFKIYSRTTMQPHNAQSMPSSQSCGIHSQPRWTTVCGFCVS
jgi:hypothetical protein